jgi:hypothetical protein
MMPEIKVNSPILDSSLSSAVLVFAITLAYLALNQKASFKNV